MKLLCLILFALYLVQPSAAVAADIPLRISDYIGITFPKKILLRHKADWSSQALPGRIAADKFTSSKAIWAGQLIQIYNPEAFLALRRNPGPAIYYYHSGFTTQKDNQGMTFDYDYIVRRHPDWIMTCRERGSASIPIRWNAQDTKHPYHERFYLDVGNPDFQTWALKALLDHLDSCSQETGLVCFDGIALDNVLLDSWHALMDGRYDDWKYKNDPHGWKNAYFSYLSVLSSGLRAKGYQLLLNHTSDYGGAGGDADWRHLMRVADGLMDESALGPPAQSPWTGERWINSLQRHLHITRNGVHDWWVVYPEAGRRSEAQWNYALGTFLLTAVPGLSVFWADPDPSLNASHPWHPYYDLPIGAPKGPAVQEGECWRREFDAGIVMVNPTSGDRNITIPERSEWTLIEKERVSAPGRMPAASARLWIRHRILEDTRFGERLKDYLQ